MVQFVPAILAGLLLVSLAADTPTVTTMEVRGHDGVREHCCEGGFERRRFSQEDPYESYGGRGRFAGDKWHGSRRLRNCYQQLRQLEEQCRCERLREKVRDQQQRQREFGVEREESERIVENLPQICGVGPGWCDIRRGSRWM